MFNEEMKILILREIPELHVWPTNGKDVPHDNDVSQHICGDEDS